MNKWARFLRHARRHRNSPPDCFYSSNCLVRFSVLYIKKGSVENDTSFFGAEGETRPLKAKAFFGTHAGTATVHRTVAILRIAFFDSLFFTSKKRSIKNDASFLAQKERLAHWKLKLSSARTQAPQQSTGLLLFFELPFSILCSLHQKKEASKMMLLFWRRRRDSPIES